MALAKSGTCVYKYIYIHIQFYQIVPGRTGAEVSLQRVKLREEANGQRNRGELRTL